MLISADLHIHSRFSIGCSKYMTMEMLSVEAKKKGVDLIGTGDCLNKGWLNEIRVVNRIDDGTLELNDTRFILSTEVEDNRRVHHLIFFPSLSKVGEFRECLRSKSKNLDRDGRPNLRMGGEEIAQLAQDVGAIIGPCHAFTPWTALYAYHDSLESCYGELVSYVAMVELGLSADTSYADRIAELERLTFLTNSDAHSPYPVRLAREFNRFEVQDVTYDELKKAIYREGGRGCKLNVGLPPQEGKYNESACIKCLRHYTLQESINANWKCPECKGRIKKGVMDRVEELADYPIPRHPGHRPEYIHIIPLAEIISKAIGHSGTSTKGVMTLWDGLIRKFGNEVAVLIDADLTEITKNTDRRVVNAIKAFRENKIVISPGGGGMYGKLELP
ncbi:TIGR00375 family protein [bacterium]|nr:TIGR00375 family protein [bacterium]